MKGYLYLSHTTDPYTNLATDEYLLRNLPADSFVLYFYVNAPSVIIGRHQNAYAECDVAKMEADGVKLVRRITGGGAVYHDEGNLNFSFIFPEGKYEESAQNEVLTDALATFGIEATAGGRNDITADGRKVSGTAYSAAGGVKQRHGTMLVSSDLDRLQRYLTVSPMKLQSKGVRSVKSRVCNLCELGEVTVESLREAIADKTADVFGSMDLLSLDETAQNAVAKLAEERKSFDWLMGEAPHFSYRVEDRFSFGMAEVLCDVRDGVIDAVTVYTDALDTTVPERIKAALEGKVFAPDVVEETIRGTF